MSRAIRHENQPWSKYIVLPVLLVFFGLETSYVYLSRIKTDSSSSTKKIAVTPTPTPTLTKTQTKILSKISQSELKTWNHFNQVSPPISFSYPKTFRIKFEDTPQATFYNQYHRFTLTNIHTSTEISFSISERVDEQPQIIIDKFKSDLPSIDFEVSLTTPYMSGHEIVWPSGSAIILFQNNNSVTVVTNNSKLISEVESIVATLKLSDGEY